MVESMCPYKPIRACSPTVQGYGTVRRGTCRDKCKSVSSSQLASAACRWGSGRSPHRWWCVMVYSSGNPCTVHSSAACRHECCSSPGEPGEWGQRRCNWSDIDPSAPSRAFSERTESSCKVSLCKDGFPFAAYRRGSGWKPEWRPHLHNSGSTDSTGCSSQRRWGATGRACSVDDP